MANKEYKSDVFSMLLQDKNRALEVYNAINGTDYDDPELVEMTTLDDKSFSLTVRNDASFILDANLSLYEHQSTYNLFDVLKISRTEIRHSNQLNRYREILEKDYPEYNRLFVFLTPDGEIPSDIENWDVLTYSDVVEVLEKVNERIKVKPDADMEKKTFSKLNLG